MTWLYHALSGDLLTDYGLGESTKIFITTVTSATFTGTIIVPSDFNIYNNMVECLGAGGTGGNNGAAAGGGGGGAQYAKKDNVVLTPSVTIDVQVGGGSSGLHTYVKDAVGGTTQVQAETPGNPATPDLGGPAGGSGGSGIGTTLRNGGAGAPKHAGGSAGGGGGAAGPYGTGSNGSTAGDQVGGAADNGNVAGGAANTAGNSGTEFSAVHGCGSGGGGGNASTPGKAGGAHGGGAGGSGANGGAAALAGGGLIVITYTSTSGHPAMRLFGLLVFTRPVEIGRSGSRVFFCHREQVGNGLITTYNSFEFGWGFRVIDTVRGGAIAIARRLNQARSWARRVAVMGG